ncbi:putative ubiquitin-like-specific protease 1B [Triticum aestivum]|uniref:putative ubiquitin-like-specific protease 1B n=1 Tax=Triticum aestivum TaxID=4565 RepID=UPI001D010C13|nr:putative ubiquitin-like-specific protease 1B [Triticum aestivum]
MGSDIRTDATMTDRTETPREENIVYMDMDSGDSRKESIEGSDAMSLQGAGNSQHNHVEEVISRNKPKKDANLHVIPQDYVYTPRDITVIETIKSAPKKTQFVDIGDALLAKDDLECLIKNDMFLHDGVINAYIYCMLAHEHLQHRAGEKVHIISTFVSGQIKEDRERDIDPSKYRRIVRHVNSYLQQDMLFIPINMPGYHWYLAVANAKKREIQVLDSLGENVKRNDLATTLLGLEKWLKLAEHSPKFIKSHKWHDLNVTKWTVVKQIQEAIQTDGVSCGLFMLNYMEYWTPHGLLDQFSRRI